MEWNPNIALRNYLSEEVHQYFRYEARFLKERLKFEGLVVVLAPAPRPMFSGHMIRVVENQNPEWYREFIKKYGRIERCLSISALERISLGKDENYIQRIEVYQDYVHVKKRGRLKGLKYRERKLRKDHRYFYDKIFRDLIFKRLTEGDENLLYFSEPVNEIREYFELEPRIENYVPNLELGF
jgi:hypothetical protein